MKIPAQARVALVTTVLAFAAGIWLFLAPFIVGYQNDWSTLANPTKNDMWVGGLLIGVAFLSLLLFFAFAVRDALREARHRLPSNPEKH